MGRMNAKALVDAALLLALQGSVAAAAAQPGDQRSRSVHEAALNELGILEYCHAEGLVDDGVVSAQREAIQRSPGVPASGSAEEASGRAGFLDFEGRQGRFVESALAQGLTLKTACEMRAAVATIKHDRQTR